MKSILEHVTMHDNSKAFQEIRRFIDERIQAVRAKDIDALVSTFAPDVLTFDVVNPLLSTGRDAIRERLGNWFSSFQGPIDFEIRDLTITASDNVAFCHGLSHVSGTRTDGSEISMFYRTTICCRKMGDNWIITHEHDSVPFNVENGRASLDLIP
jgi:uncharacterized protein (TIGR02246 family)